MVINNSNPLVFLGIIKITQKKKVHLTSKKVNIAMKFTIMIAVIFSLLSLTSGDVYAEKANGSLSKKPLEPDHNDRGYLIKGLYYPGNGHISAGERNRGYMYLGLSASSLLAGTALSLYGLSLEEDLKVNPSNSALRDHINLSYANANALILGSFVTWGISLLDLWLSPPQRYSYNSEIKNQLAMTAPPKPLMERSNTINQQPEIQTKKVPGPKVTSERSATGKDATTKAADERAATLRAEATEKAAAERAAAERVAAEKATAEKAAAEKAAAEKAAAEKAAAEKAAAASKSRSSKDIHTFQNDPNGRYSIQVKAFTSQKFADKFIQKMSNKIKPLRVQKSVKKGKEIFRVKLGRFTTRKDAQREGAIYERIMKVKPYITKAD